MRSIFRVFILTFLSLSSVFAQDEDAHLRRIDDIAVLAGRWNVSVDFRLSAQGSWESSRATSEIIRTVGSRVLYETFSGTRKGHPFSAMALFGADNLTLDYQLVSADSEHGALIMYEGTMSGDTLTFDRMWTYPNGESVNLRKAYIFISANEFAVESMRKPADATAWDVTGRMRYVRAEE